jgi:glucan biosynthesis protein C
MSQEFTADQESLPSPPASESRSAVEPRLFYIDNLRLILITLVVVGHMAITYGAPLGNWYYREGGEVSSVFEILSIYLLGIGSSFLLGLFYLIAGYFTPRACDRKGPWRFSLERLVRLGLPLLLYALLINPLVTYWAALAGGYQGTILEYIPGHLPNLVNASIGPLWFIEALLIFSLIYALGRFIIEGKTPARDLPGIRPLPGNRAVLLFALILGLATFLLRIWVPMGWWWEPIHQEPAHFPQYIAFFALGILAYRGNWFQRFPTSQARGWGWAALALVPVLGAISIWAGALRDEFNQEMMGGFNWLSLSYSLWESLIGTALILFSLVWFRERWDRQGRWMQSWSRAAYAVYVLHPLVIVPLALALKSIHLELEVKFLLVTPLAILTCFLVGSLARVLPVLNRFL